MWKINFLPSKLLKKWDASKIRKKNGIYCFALYMAYLVPRNHFKDTKLMVFYWLSRGHIDNWSKNDFSHRKLKKAEGARKKTLKIGQKMLQLHFWHNSVNFCLLGCSKSPQLMVYIDNQFWPFSFCEKFIFNIENGRKSGMCRKFEKKMPFTHSVITWLIVHPGTNLKTPN